MSNNGRPEHTRRLAERITDPRVRWIEQPPSATLANFLAALSVARGEYVAPLHDDDWWHPQFLARVVPPLRAHGTAVVAFADQWQVNVDGEIDQESSEYFSAGSGRATLAEGFHEPFTRLAACESIPQIGCVFRRDAISLSDIPSDVGPALDFWTGYLLAITGRAAYFCRDRLVYSRLHENSDFLLDQTENFMAAVYCARRMLLDPRMAADREELSRRLAVRQQWVGGTLLRQGSRKSARVHLVRALRLRPTAKGVGAWTASWVAPAWLLGRL